MGKTKTTLDNLAVSVNELAEELKNTNVTIENLALSTKQGFDNVDFKFTVIDDRLKDLQKNDQKLENKIDHVYDQVLKNSDAFTRFKNYLDAETAALRGHLLGVDEKIGLV